MVVMSMLTVQTVRERLPELLCETSVSHIPVEIFDENHPCVLVSAEDWKAIQETLYVLSIPGMRESLLEGLQTPLSECTEVVR
jgi:PHD/YefM family antitoxin component YafN of YafNO toxin-antitoxin module